MNNYTITISDQTITVSIPEQLSILFEQTVFSSILQKKYSQQASNFKISVTKDNQYHLFYNQKQIIETTVAEKIIYTLEWNIVDQVISRHKNFLQLHCAVANDSNSSFLFVGNAGTGKTSLAILLSKLGYNILSDEVGLIDMNRQIALPFPRNFIIKPHLWDVITVPDNYQSLLIDKNISGTESAYFLPLTYFNAENTFTTQKIEKIFFLNSYNGLFMEKIGDHQAFNQLLPQIFNAQKNNIQAIIELIKSIPCYKLNLHKPLLFNEKDILKFSTYLKMDT